MRARGWAALAVAIGLSAACASPSASPAQASMAGPSAGAAPSPGGASRPRAVSIETFPDPPQASELLVIAVHGLSPGDRASIQVTPGGPAVEVRTTVDGLARVSVVLGDAPPSGWTITVTSAGDTVASRTISPRSVSAAAPSASPATLPTAEPASRTPGPLQTPVASTPSIGGGQLQVLRSFAGVDAVQTPPDVDLAVGPVSLLLTTNTEYALRDKNGALITRIPTRSFYAGPLGLVGGGVVDSETLYDELSGRFFVGASGSSGEGPWSAFLLAVSKSSDPRTFSAADWYFYALDGRVDRLADGDHATPYNVDGTALTVAAKIVVMTARMESYHLGPSNDIQQYLKVRVIDKAAALAGTLTSWRDIINLTFPGTAVAALGVAPAHAIGPASNVFLAQPTGCGFSVWSLADAYPPGDVVSGFAPLASGCVGNYSRQPVDAPQPDGTTPLSVANVGARDFKGVYLDGHLYLTHLTGWSVDAGVTNAIRWADVDVRAWPQNAAIVQQGIIAASDSTVFFPAIAINRVGDVVLVYGRSSATEAASIWVAGRAASDPNGTLRPAVLLHPGANAFEQLVYGSNRWGDYFGAALDPVDGSLWVSGQYPVARSSSATWVAQVRVGH